MSISDLALETSLGGQICPGAASRGWLTVSGGRSGITGRRRRLPGEVASGSPAPSKETTPLQSTVLFLLPLRAWLGAEVPGLGCPWALGRRRGQGTSSDVWWLSLSPAVLFSSSAKSVSDPRSRLRKVKMLPRLERGFAEVLPRPWALLGRFWGHREKPALRVLAAQPLRCPLRPRELLRAHGAFAGRVGTGRAERGVFRVQSCAAWGLCSPQAGARGL